MKHLSIALLLMTASQLGRAETFSSTIHSIDFGKASESHLVRFDNSRVVFVDAGDDELMSALVASRQREEKVEVKTNTENEVVAAQTAGPSDLIEPDEESWDPEPEPYDPTVVRSYNTALAIQNRMRKDYERSGECYNRAHIWAYEEHERSGRNLMKIFMFFTERYIRRYKFHWWFHVTPMVYVGSMSSPRTLDRRYTGGPRQTKVWSDIFIKSKRTCRKVRTYDDYYLNQDSQDCYHIHTSMYYVIPRDIEKRDLTGVEKTGFNEREIRRAYQNGFGQE